MKATILAALLPSFGIHNQEAFMEQRTDLTTHPEAAEAKKGVKKPLVILVVLLILLAAAYGGLCAWALHSAALWRNTYILGVNVGGMDPVEAAAAVSAALPEMEIQLYLYPQDGALPDRQSQSSDAVIPLSDLGAQIDEAALVQGADRAQRSGSVLTAGWRYLTGGSLSYAGSGEIAVSSAAAYAAATTTAAALSWDPQDTTYQVTEDSLEITLAKDGRTVDAENLAQQLEAGDWICDLALSVPYAAPSAKTLTAQEIHDDTCGVVKNAGYDAATGTIIPEQIGAEFDVSAAQSAMDAAQPGETVSLHADVELPTVTAAELEQVLFRDVLGECRTHVSGTSARISNVKLAAAAFNGTVLNSGDVFSYNGTVGERTAAKGYKAAPAYVQGETVDEIGGGVCQPSSTLYLACLRANLEITERYAHRYVPAYIPWGMDATVSWGGPDYKFTNNTDYPIKIVTEYSGGYLTVKLLGTNADGITAKITNETLSTTPWTTVYEDDPTLPAGTETVKTTPYTGYKVRTYRNLYDADGNLISSTYEATSDYKVRNKVVLRGPELPETPDVPAVNPDTDPGTGEGGAGPSQGTGTPSETPSGTTPETGSNTSTDTGSEPAPDPGSSEEPPPVIVVTPETDPI